MPIFNHAKRLFRKPLVIFFNSKAHLRAEPIGVINEVKYVAEDSKNMYQIGQPFLHKIFGYRGIIISTWNATLYDKVTLKIDKAETSPASKTTQNKASTSTGSDLNYRIKKDRKVANICYYLVIVDKQDKLFTDNVLKDGVTFLVHNETTSLMNVYGIDYVTHDDILPYEPINFSDPPIDNDFFSSFFTITSNSSSLKEKLYSPSSYLQDWLCVNKKTLDVVSVHRETTDGIRVTIIPFFMGSVKTKKSHDSVETWRYWRYVVRIENTTNEPRLLRERVWKIFSLCGQLESIRGTGVIGIQPLLDKFNPIFQYHSHVYLRSGFGHMWGSYTFVKPNKSMVEVQIPPFPLAAYKSNK